MLPVAEGHCRAAHGSVRTAGTREGGDRAATCDAAVLSVVGAAPSFADTFAEVHADCVRLAWHLTSDRDDAEDIAADVLAAAWERYERGEIDDLRRYLMRAVANRSKSWLRRRYVRRRVHGTASGDDRGIRWYAEDVADRDEMWTALHQLPSRQRVTVVLRYYEGLSVAETARVLGVREGTVKSNTARGLAKLEELLSAEGAGR
jgi:RNA polymerase sigma-70 factor (sigma-E family)